MKLVMFVSTAVMATAVLVGCQTKCIDPPDEGVDRDTILKLQKAVNKDPSVCKQLGHPRVNLTTTDLVLTAMKDQKLATRESLPATELKRIEPLFKQLKSSREMWKQIHPGESFPGEVDITLDPLLETPRALSVIHTSAFAGFPTMHVTAGPTSFDTSWEIPMPPEEDSKKERVFIFIDAKDDNTLDLRRSTSKCRQLGKAKAASASELLGALASVCSVPSSGPTAETGCANAVEIVVPASSRFGDVVKLASDMLRAIKPAKPNLRITPRGKETLEESLGLAGKGEAGGKADAPWGREGTLPCTRKPKTLADD